MKRDFKFLINLLIVVLVLVVGILVRGKKEVSLAENRELEDFMDFSIEAFLDNSYQTNIEDALIDQLLFGEHFKKIYNSFKGYNTSLIVDGLNRVDTFINDEKEVYGIDEATSSSYEFLLDLTPVGDGLIRIDESCHLIAANRSPEVAEDLFERKANNYNDLSLSYPDLCFNIYYIESDVDIDFVNGKINHDLVESFYEKLNDSINKEAFLMGSYEEYQEYFYKTDHHWNTRGQLKGYQDIIGFLKGTEEEFLNIESIYFEDIVFNGSKSRRIDNYEIYDEFSILYGELPSYELYINGRKASYGKKEIYLGGEYSSEKGFGHYGEANGGDYGLIEYRFNKAEEENILIFVDSFSNPINTFIASHFNKTYIVDLRDYQRAYGQEFDFDKFIAENKVDRVLFMGYYFFYANDLFLIK